MFEIDDAGTAEPVFHRRVSLPEAPASVSAERLLKARALAERGRQMVWIEQRSLSGTTDFRQVVEAGAEIRGEFHGLAWPGGGSEIDHVRVAAERPAFVVRVPVGEAGAVLKLSGAGEAEIDLDRLERRADQLALASLVLPVTAVKTVDKTSSANRADFLIMGDGYTAAQRNQFQADANRLASQFFALTPYREYRSYAKVSQLFTASAQSGADHPPYRAGCNSTDCCGDTAAQGDPRAGTFVQTAFDATFCTANIHRLLTANPSKVFAAASASPGWDQILVLVNDPVFGGAGGSIAVGSLHGLATEIMQHEVGHSFTGLADEYDTPITGTLRCSENVGSCEANVTDRTQRQQIKWAPWIAGSTPVPTPAGGGYSAAVGVFEGARYFTTGQYRPRDNCAMRTLGVEFGEICRQEYVLRLFRGGFGVPANGIDPIEPGSENPRPGTVDAGSEAVSLSVALLQPSAGPGLNVQWRVDGQAIEGASGSSFTFEPERAGSYRVELRVDAATPLVHPAMAGEALKSSRTWMVRSDGVRGPLTAAFEWQGDQAGVAIRFTSTATGEPQAHAWQFGDGTTATQPNPVHVFAEPGLYPVRLTVTRDGESASLSRTVEVFASAPGACVETADSLCLQSEGRFKVEALWRDSAGATGIAPVVPFASADSGLMVFFDAENWETLVKVLDGCAFNDHFWVFAAATTDVEYVLRVTDTDNGLAKIYRNPSGNASPAITDTEAFQTCEPGAGAGLERVELGATQPQEPSRRESTPAGVACVEDTEHFCLNDARFEVSISWRDFQGNTGMARQTAASSDRSGVMWFFSADNWELLVKVLDGCAINQNYWVFAAATTNVEYTLRVRDSISGEVVEYFNPLGTASPSITDTGALAVCP